MKNYYLYILFLLTTVMWGQKIELDIIKKEVTDLEAPFYYEKLIKELKNSPEKFITDSTKIKYLYYGKLFSEYTNKTKQQQSDDLKFLRLVVAKKYEKAVELGESLIDKDPVNLMILMNLKECYSKLETNKERIEKLKTQVEAILKAIALSGDGRKEETAFKVISLRDEYTLLSYMEFDLKRYSQVSKKLSKEVILDVWIKDKDYKSDHREKVFVEVLSYNSKALKK